MQWPWNEDHPTCQQHPKLANEYLRSHLCSLTGLFFLNRSSNAPPPAVPTIPVKTVNAPKDIPAMSTSISNRFCKYY